VELGEGGEGVGEQEGGSLDWEGSLKGTGGVGLKTIPGVRKTEISACREKGG